VAQNQQKVTNSERKQKLLMKRGKLTQAD